MENRWPWLAAAIVVLLLAFVGLRGCRDVGEAQGPAAAGTTASDDGRTGPDHDAEAEVAAARHASMTRRNAAMQSAVSTLQRYLAMLGEDVARADAFWVGGKPPASSGEADLRTLRDLRALRIENKSPVALDSNAVPEALEIPVELRISTGDAPMRRYRGWYRLRRAIDGERWEITSAAIDASSPRR